MVSCGLCFPLLLVIALLHAGANGHSETSGQADRWRGSLKAQTDIDRLHTASDINLTDEEDEDICHAWDWRKKSLKLVREMPISGLFRDLKGYSKFEASGITRYGNQVVMVFDSLQELGFVDADVQFMGAHNKLAGKAGDESSYEAITLRTRTNTLLAVVEAVEQQHWHAIVHEIAVSDDQKLLPVRECLVDYALPEGASKGFEGAQYYDAGDRGEYLLALCEGNYCEGYDGRGQEAGNGRIVVTKLTVSDDGTCKYTTEKVVKIPPAAYFVDYSDIDILEGRVAISSQENSSLWVGYIDWETFEFVDDGEVLHFPRSSHCVEMYCNVEGLQWLDKNRIMTTTDRAKRDQPWHCSAKDQSVQVFALPYNKHLNDNGDDEL